MNKKLNTLIYVVIATIVNIIIAIVCIGVLLFLLGRLEPLMGENISFLAPFALVGGIILSMIIFQRISNWAIVKFDLENKLDPLFKPKKRRKK